MASVKRKRARRYDASGRREQAEQTRASIIRIARTELEKHGYAATTVAAVAERAGVSVETIYKSFGGKPGLVRAIYEQGLAGSGARPAPSRSDELMTTENDPHAIVRGWGRLAAEVSPRVAPIGILVRDAAVSEPALRKILDEIDAQRLERMRHNVGVLARRGFLKIGVTVEAAAELCWALLSHDLYDSLVVRHGWTLEQFGDFIATTLDAALLD